MKSKAEPGTPGSKLLHLDSEYSAAEWNYVSAYGTVRRVPLNASLNPPTVVSCK